MIPPDIFVFVYKMFVRPQVHIIGVRIKLNTKVILRNNDIKYIEKKKK